MRPPAWAVAALLALPAPAAAQVTASEHPQTLRAERCFARSGVDPQEMLVVSERLLADASLPRAAQAAALACRARAQQALVQGRAAARNVDRMLALAEAPDTPPELRRKVWIRAVDILMPTVHTRQTMALLDRLMEHSRQQGDASVAAFLLHSMARLHVSQMDNPAAALPVFDAALELVWRTGRPNSLREMQLHYNRGYTLLRMARYEEAEAAFALTERMARHVQQQRLLDPRLASARGEIRRAAGDLARARRLLADAEAAQRANGDLRGLDSTLLRLAQLALDEDDLGAARKHAGEALALADAGQFRSEARDALALLEAVHLATGEQETAERHRERRRALDASLDRDAALATLARMRARVERDLGPGALRAPDLGRARLARDTALAVLVLALGCAFLVLRRPRRRASRAEDAGLGPPPPPAA